MKNTILINLNDYSAFKRTCKLFVAFFFQIKAHRTLALAGSDHVIFLINRYCKTSSDHNYFFPFGIISKNEYIRDFYIFTL